MAGYKCFDFGAWGKAGAAALALVAIQVGTGVLYKAVQKDGGGYSFSQSAAVTISEFLKFTLATLLFYREHRRRIRTRNSNPRIRINILPVSSSTHIPIPLKHTDDNDDDFHTEDIYSSSSSFSSDDVDGRKSNDTVGLLDKEDWENQDNTLNLYNHDGTEKGFFIACIEEVPPDTRNGFINLAFFYAMINNLVFVLFILADPGTIQLMKSGVTLITAIVFLLFLNKPVSKGQWIAVALQVTGLIVSQYRANSATFPLGTYLLLASQTFLSAVSGVYNQVLNKSGNSSLHGDNMVLYFGGVVINLCVHIMMRFIREDEPFFFQGFSELRPVMLVVSQVFVGLAVTAVYKYADALVKCFATAISTGILLYISPLLFQVQFGFLTLPGTIIVFIATYLYIDEGRPTDPNRPPNAFQRLYASYKRLTADLSIPSAWLVKLLFNAITTLCIIASFQRFGERIKHDKEAALTEGNDRHVLTTQFSNVLAYVRWNSYHPERIPLLSQYEPFFHTVHYSIPSYANATNVTHDGYVSTFTPYVAVSETMAVILNSSLPEHKNITGLFYFHFDAWVDPFGFNSMDPEKIWFPDSDNPAFFCMRNATEEYKGWAGWFRHDTHEVVGAAMSSLAEKKTYVTDGVEFCTGWSDIYYIPRRYWADYIYLSSHFSQHKLFHELAIPTMVNLIDRTRRSNPVESDIIRIGDCWGNCCSSNPPIKDVKSRRCGHKLDMTNAEMVETHYGKLRRLTELLGTETEEHGHWNMSRWVQEDTITPPDLTGWTEGRLPEDMEFVDLKDTFGAPNRL